MYEYSIEWDIIECRVLVWVCGVHTVYTSIGISRLYTYVYEVNMDNTIVYKYEYTFRAGYEYRVNEK